MSLHDRITLTEKKSATTFKDTPGQDAFLHTDGSKSGRRNLTGGGKFVKKKWRRYPVPDKSRASAMGSLSQAIQRSQSPQKIAKAIQKKFKGTCPYILPGCPPKRNHGAGGPDEHRTGNKGSEKGSKGRWPFVVGKNPKWDREWKGLSTAKKPQQDDVNLSRRELLTVEG